MKIIVLSLFFSICTSSNILLMFPLSLKSHVSAFFPLFKKLSENGHNLTMVVPFTPQIQLDNCTFIIVRNMFQEEMSTAYANQYMQNYRKMNGFSYWCYLWEKYSRYLEKFLREDCLAKLYQGNYTFDLMISETLYLQELFVAFGHIYNIPVINIDSHAPSVWPCYLTGNTNPYSYVPNYKLPFTDHMTFTERVENTLLNVFEVLGFYCYYLPKQEELIRKYLRNGKEAYFPPLLDLLKNTSLTLVDSHFTLGYVRPYLPNMIEVGGLSFISNDELDEEYQQFMNESKNGVIFVSFGSVLRMSVLPQDMINILISTFAQLKQNVIMKWEAGELPNKPKNVKTAEWLPQNGILAHPNCRLFISHGGIHGLSEAIYNKVPLVILPFFSDQFYNAKLAEKGGFGHVLSRSNLTTESLHFSISSVLQNADFKKNIERRSLILKDKAISSLDNALYWVEYVLRHKGAMHLRPASLDLNIFQYLLLDVILLVSLSFIAAFIIISSILYFLIKFFITIKLKFKQKSD